MPQKYYNTKEAAKVLGISDADVKQLLDARELHGYRDGADWKFKTEDIERMAKERASGGSSEDEGDVLLSEVELGHSDPGMSGTVIGADKPGGSSADSDIRLAASDVKLDGSEIKLAESDIKLAESDVGLGGSEIDLAEKKPAAAHKDELAAKNAHFEALDLTLDQDLTLEDSGVAVSPPPQPAKDDSAVDLGGKKLEDDDLVLGGSGTGSDITIGGDSGISLVDPADSGLSLESPLNLAGSEESLELGEDDLLAFSTEGEPSGLKSEDDFQLTPMDEGADADDSESGSQVIALDTEGEGDEAATMIGGSSSVAAMLEEDLSTEPGLAAAPLLAGAGELALAGSPDGLGMDASLAASMSLPEAPYSIWNIVSLVLCSLLLILVGMMMYDLMRNMWGWEHATSANSAIMDTIVSWFEK